MLIDSGANQIAPSYNGSEFLRAIKMAQAEELSAQNTYDYLFDVIEKMGENKEINKELLKKISNRLSEIHTDEINHTGSLQWIIEAIDPYYKNELGKGYAGA